MRKVTTNMTFGQVLFVLFILVLSSLMFFYLGARFGREIINSPETRSHGAERGFFPDEKLASEMKNLIAEHNDDFVFHEAVEKTGPWEAPLAAAANHRQESGPSALSATAAGKTALIAAPTSLIAAKPAPDAPKKVLLPAPPPPAVSDSPIPLKPASSSYRLQVGSYARKKRALAAKREWEQRGYAVEINESVLPGKGRWYRLKLDRPGSLNDLRNEQRKIMDSFQETAMIVAE